MRRAAVAILCGLLLLAGCGDDGAERAAPRAQSGSAASPSGPADTGAPTPGDGGYDYASDVSSHRMVVADVCDIRQLLADGDFAGAARVYRDGENSVNDDGSVRTIGGFASREDRNPVAQEYYGAPTPLDDHVTAALQGTGPFDGEPDAVRQEAGRGAIQDQVMIAWVIHELDEALKMSAEGKFDAATGVPHKIDEAWAFYHGAAPECAPYATAGPERDAVLAALIRARDGALAGDAAAVQAADAEVRRAFMITYSREALRHADAMGEAVAAGDREAARVAQAAAWSAWRTIEPAAAAAGADAAAINGVLALGAPPGEGAGAVVRAALRPAWEALGVTEADVVP